MSNCIVRGFGGIDDPGNDNPFCLYSDPGRAMAMVPIEARADVALYAYRLWPVQFDDGREEVNNLWWEPTVEPMSVTFVRLGWDAIEGGNGRSFGCSPLSCNSGADIVRCPDINRYCLVDNEPAAMALARSFSITKPEPGPYCVVEVWRDMAAAAESEVALDRGGM